MRNFTLAIPASGLVPAGLALGLGLLPTAPARAQAASSYLLTATTGTFAPLAGGTAVPAILHDDAVSGSLPIGFAFAFGGASYTTFQVSSNGLLGLGGGLSTVGAELSNTFSSPQLAGASLPVFAPFWTDLYGGVDSGATAQYALSGTAPGRVLTMEWLDFYDLNGDAAKYISFQVKLSEADGRITYCYRRGPTGEAGDATIGLKGLDGSFLSLTNAGATPGTSATTSYNRLNRPATGQVYTLSTPAAPLAAASPLAAAEVAVFPNPAHQRLTVLIPASAVKTAVQADLFNALGQVVSHQAGPAASGAPLTLALAGLAPGVYTLRLRVGEATLAKRVVLD